MMPQRFKLYIGHESTKFTRFGSRIPFVRASAASVWLGKVPFPNRAFLPLTVGDWFIRKFDPLLRADMPYSKSPSHSWAPITRGNLTSMGAINSFVRWPIRKFFATACADIFHDCPPKLKYPLGAGVGSEATPVSPKRVHENARLVSQLLQNYTNYNMSGTA